MTTKTFKSELAREMRIKARELFREGVRSISVANFRQIVRPPAASLEGAPRGTNAAWAYAEMFRELCDGKADHEMVTINRIPA